MGTNLECDEALADDVPAEPDGGEAAPAELADHVVALVVQVAYAHLAAPNDNHFNIVRFKLDLLFEEN